MGIHIALALMTYDLLKRESLALEFLAKHMEIWFVKATWRENEWRMVTT